MTLDNKSKQFLNSLERGMKKINLENCMRYNALLRKNYTYNDTSKSSLFSISTNDIVNLYNKTLRDNNKIEYTIKYIDSFSNMEDLPYVYINGHPHYLLGNGSISKYSVYEFGNPEGFIMADQLSFRELTCVVDDEGQNNIIIYLY